MKSFGVEVIADGSGTFSKGYLRFATRGEAEEFARDLANRWTLVSDWRVVESEDPANSKEVTQCQDCDEPTEQRTCEDCGAQAVVIDCGHHPQPAAISASAHRTHGPVCGDCETTRAARHAAGGPK